MANRRARTIYGIPTCDTVRKARAWLDGEGLEARFHDIRAEPLDRTIVEGWIERLGADKVLNKASTTFRGLSESDKARASGEALVDLLLEHPTLIRRPVLETGEVLLIGFKPEVWSSAVRSKDSD